MARPPQSRHELILVDDIDPSADSDGVTDKMFVDATTDESFRGEFITLDPDARERAEELLGGSHEAF